MTRRKICVVVTSRPSYSRIKSAMEAIKSHPDLDLQLIVAGSALLDRYGSAVKYLEADSFRVDHRIYSVLEGETLASMALTTGLSLVELPGALENLNPDVVVTVADRYETIATAIAASYMNIPLAHVQGGEVTGSIDEKVRHAITKLSDLHFASTESAAERIIRMGEDPETVFVTGCPSIDLAARIVDSPTLDFDPYKKYGGVGSFVDITNGYIVVMQHPVTTEYEIARKQITETLKAVHEADIPALWFWPNVDAGSDGVSTGIRVYREHENPRKIHFFKNMEPDDFLRLLYNSQGIVGNSSVGIRECSYLGVPAINIGNRQIGRERGANVTDVSYEKNEIRNAILETWKLKKFPRDTIYGDGNAGKRIAKALAETDLKYEKRIFY